MSGMAAVQELDTDDAKYPGLRGAWWIVMLLFMGANLYSIDKSIVGVLAEPIRKTLAISDVQMGLLLGFAYTFLSSILGLVLGNFTDHHSRRRILAFSIILWSVATVAGGLATSFGWFFVFRALVGLGEAGLAPTALSVIADIFPARQRGRALSGYFIGATMGTALSSVIPGWIISADLHLTLPFFGVIEPWRSAFLICGSIGPVIGLLFLTAKEPARHGARWTEGVQPPIREKMAYLWQRKALIAPLYAGFCFYYVAFVGITSWTVVFLTRAFHSDLPSFAGELGLVMLVAGVGGYVLGGLLSDSPVGRRLDGKMLLLTILPMVAVPSTLAGLMSGIPAALVMLATISFATPMLNVAMNTALQQLLPNDMRGFSYGLLSVVIALPAGAGGPLLFALVTEQVLRDPTRIGTSFMIVGLPSLVLASGSFLMARKACRRFAPPSTS